MKKLGFTLSEVIITLGIIGIVAAITAPMIDGIMPDKNKAMVLKVYKTVSDINKELLNDRSLYIIQENCQGLDCLGKPSNPTCNKGDENDWLYGTPAKYSMLLSDSLHCDGREPIGNQGAKFRTSDGIYWEIKRIAGEEKIIINGTDPVGDGCSWGANGCEKPNEFSFIVQNNGHISGDDPLTKAYLENPYKLNDKKKDYARAKEINKS